jgi:hypothetical protein
MFLAVCHWLLIVEAHVQSQASPCEICGGQICTGTWFPPSIAVVPCQCHSTNAPYSYIHPSLVLYNLTNWVSLNKTLLSLSLSLTHTNTQISVSRDKWNILGYISTVMGLKISSPHLSSKYHCLLENYIATVSRNLTQAPGRVWW